MPYHPHHARPSRIPEAETRPSRAQCSTCPMPIYLYRKNRTLDRRIRYLRAIDRYFHQLLCDILRGELGLRGNVKANHKYTQTVIGMSGST